LWSRLPCAHRDGRFQQKLQGAYPRQGPQSTRTRGGLRGRHLPPPVVSEIQRHHCKEGKASGRKAPLHQLSHELQTRNQSGARIERGISTPSSAARASSWVSAAFFINSPEGKFLPVQAYDRIVLVAQLNEMPQIELAKLVTVLKLIIDDQHQRSISGRRDVHASRPSSARTQ
jgi:hypothetical protein